VAWSIWIDAGEAGVSEDTDEGGGALGWEVVVTLETSETASASFCAGVEDEMFTPCSLMGGIKIWNFPVGRRIPCA
jgi:hypothetical protein